MAAEKLAADGHAGGAQAGHFESTCRFIEQVGATALGCGVSSFRVDACLSRLARRAGLESDFLVVPEKIVSALWRQGDERPRISLVRPDRAGLNMAGAAEVEELVDEVESGAVSLDEGLSRLDDVQRSRGPFSAPVIAVSFALIGAAFAVLMALPVHDVVIGGVLGVVTFGVVMLMERAGRLARATVPVAAFVAGFLSYLAAAVLAPASHHALVALCALICLVPNPGLVLGVGELSSGHTLSGTARLLASGVVLVELAFGAFIGTAAAGALWTIPSGATAAGLGPGWSWPAVAVLGMGLALLFQVRPREIWLVGVGSLLAWCGIVIGGKLMGSGPGEFCGALLLGLFANACGFHRKHAPTVILLPALMVLAPGYASYLELGKFQTSGVDAGFFAEFGGFITIAWTIAGLFVANTRMPPAGSRRRREA